MQSTLLCSLALAVIPVAVLAQNDDPPARVARLNYLTGSVSFRPGTVEEWNAATPNYPMTTGDHLWADQGAAAELHIGSNALRISSETALEVLNLDDRTAQFSLTQGMLSLRLRRLDAGEIFEVDTPNGAVTILRPGDYRFDVLADNNGSNTYVTVRNGEAQVTGAGDPFLVRAREVAHIVGPESPRHEVNLVRDADGWDQWCVDRDRREDEAAAAVAQYVPPEMVGYEDLHANGVWRSYPEYGAVWVPRVQAGWAPYRYGHWAWVAPWGWTWIDDAPWGFAPFHYGRWVYAGGGWAWIPGRMVARPVYAPALVVFVGGDRFHSSLAWGSGGGVAWFPLGPREVYRPAYHVSEVYVRNVNVTHNVTNITNVYVNQHVAGAVTAVPHAAFVGARPVAPVAVRISPEAMRRAEIMHAAAVVPRQESVTGRYGSGRVAVPPAQVVNRQVVARTAPPPPPVSFTRSREALQASQGRPLDPATVNRLRAGAPATNPSVRPAGGGYRPANAATQPAWQPAQPAQQPAMNRPAIRQAAPASAGGTPPAQTTQPSQPAQPAGSNRPPASDRNYRPPQPASPRPQTAGDQGRPAYRAPQTPPRQPGHVQRQPAAPPPQQQPAAPPQPQARPAHQRPAPQQAAPPQ